MGLVGVALVHGIGRVGSDILVQLLFNKTNLYITYYTLCIGKRETSEAIISHIIKIVLA